MMRIIDYSDKAIAVIGDTKPYKDELKAIGGKFNPYLKCGAGWIFSAKRKAEVELFISGHASTPKRVFTPDMDELAYEDRFDMGVEDEMAERAGVGSRLSPFWRGSY